MGTDVANGSPSGRSRAPHCWDVVDRPHHAAGNAAPRLPGPRPGRTGTRRGVYLILANTAGPERRGSYELLLRSSREDTGASTRPGESFPQISVGETVEGLLDAG